MWRRRKRALKGERVTVYAQLVNMMSRIVTHNRLRDGSLKNAIFANRPNKRVEGKISIQVVHSIQLGVERRVDHHHAPSGAPFGPNEISDILFQNIAIGTLIFRVQLIKTGHISITYRQTSDVLSVLSKGIAAAK